MAKYLFLLAVIFFLSSCSSIKKVTKYNNTEGHLIETGIASWYGPNFDGKLTANGETFDMRKLTAAHRTLPFDSIIKVINKSNKHSVIVRINDRGPYAKNRIIDLSKRAAEKIGLISKGFTEVDLILLSASKLPNNLKVPHYTLQIGSYKTYNEAVKISSKFNNARVIKTLLNRQIYYRVYIGFFTNKLEVEKLKKSLQKEGINGFVKQTEN